MLKHPIEAWRENSIKQPIKRNTIFGALTLGMLVLLNLATMLSAVMSSYSRKVRGYENCSIYEIWGMRWNAIREIQSIGLFARKQRI